MVRTRKLWKPHWISYTRTDDSCGPPAPKLQSLTLTEITLRRNLGQKLLDVLAERCDGGAFKSLVVRLCCVYDCGYKEKFGELVETLTWEEVTPAIYTSSDEETESE